MSLEFVDFRADFIGVSRNLANLVESIFFFKLSDIIFAKNCEILVRFEIDTS